MTSSIARGTTLGSGVHVVTITATDSEGNSVPCSFVINVQGIGEFGFLFLCRQGIGNVHSRGDDGDNDDDDNGGGGGGGGGGYYDDSGNGDGDCGGGRKDESGGSSNGGDVVVVKIKTSGILRNICYIYRVVMIVMMKIMTATKMADVMVVVIMISLLSLSLWDASELTT